MTLTVTDPHGMINRVELVYQSKDLLLFHADMNRAGKSPEVLDWQGQTLTLFSERDGTEKTCQISFRGFHTPDFLHREATDRYTVFVFFVRKELFDRETPVLYQREV